MEATTHNIATMFSISELGYWLPVKDGDPRAFGIFKRHYSYYDYADGRRDKYGADMRIAGPGFKIVLLGADEQALFVWRQFDDASGQQGINCAVFRNESQYRASDLIREADAIAWARWPGVRLYTYVNPRAVQSGAPGYCFRKAGWRWCGVTSARKLHIWEHLPA